MTLSESSNCQRTLTGCRVCMFFFLLDFVLMFYTAYMGELTQGRERLLKNKNWTLGSGLRFEHVCSRSA